MIAKCYRPSVISITVTKGGHPRGSGLYGTSRTMGRGVTKLCKRKFSTCRSSERGNVST